MTGRLSSRFRVLALVSLVALAVQAGQAETLAGWVERARVYPSGLALRAKLDTGAMNSSLHTRDLKRFERSGATWVLFQVTDHHGTSVEIQRPVIRTARVKRPSGESQERPVVILGICVGKVRKDVEVNLVDRSKFLYPLLLGRSFLAGDLVVDSARRYTLAPACPNGADPQ